MVCWGSRAGESLPGGEAFIREAQLNWLCTEERGPTFSITKSHIEYWRPRENPETEPQGQTSPKKMAERKMRPSKAADRFPE